MQIMNTKKEDIDKALALTNKVFNGNVVFKRFDSGARGMSHTVTLTIKDSNADGGRRGYNFRKDGERTRVHSACWHVHGVFMDSVFINNPKARIRALGRIITAEDGNWEDSNIGSYFNPLMHSEACECDNDHGLSLLIGDLQMLAEQKIAGI